MNELQKEAFTNLATGGGADGMFGFTVWALLAGIAFSTIGYFYFRAGKRNSDFTTLGTGVVLMVFPYFVTRTPYIILIGAGIMGWHYYRDRL
ncbi:MAG: hypothetical protein NTY45_07465 [Elusimicrobia bacterium]|nr:hypothetical protein [Elusimicrobiota bacterium]